jgi:predicted lipid carrier protein YhbT
MTLPKAVPLLLNLVPAALPELVGRLAFARVVKRHPRLLSRIGEHAARTYAFAPTDIPFEFAVTPRTGTVIARRRGSFQNWDVRISGSMVVLLALAEGRIDGDAEFFGRQITIEGDMEAALALRNAVENEDIDLTRDLAPDGIVRGPVEAGLARLRTWLLNREERRWN